MMHHHTHEHSSHRHDHQHDGHEHPGEPAPHDHQQRRHDRGSAAHDHCHDGLDEDAHARAHAAEIERRFASGRASNLQTVLFGLSGGLVPCSAAITVLILCLNIGKTWLGIALVAAFSVGLAVTLVGVGVAASIGARVLAERSGAVGRLLDRAPYLSAVVVLVVGISMILSGL